MNRRNDMQAVKHPPILALSYSEAELVFSQPVGQEVRALISIHGQREPVLNAVVPSRLDLEFDDVDAVDVSEQLASAVTSMRNRQAAEIGMKIQPPTAEHAQKIIDFAKASANLQGVVLCQCRGGISRSPAAVLICLAVWNGPGKERDCVEELLKVRPIALPHPGLVELGDRLLNRDGRLIKAVSEYM